MKIYKRDEFLKLPEGTVFHKAQEDSYCFGTLSFKGQSLEYDFYCLDTGWIDGEDSTECFDRLEEMITNKASYPMQCCESRDGLFEENAIFLVYEKDDLIKLRSWIDDAIKGEHE